MLGSLRQAARAARSGARKFQSSAAAAGGHGGEDYLHAPSMYNIPAMKNRKLKFGLAVFGVVGLGSAIPFIACEFQHYKARG